MKADESYKLPLNLGGIKTLDVSTFFIIKTTFRMKFLAALALALAAVQATPVKRADPQGIDVSDYQTSINWGDLVANGIQFVYIKATEGTSSAF